MAINYSNYTNNTCKLLIGNENLKDGKIPQVLALAVGVWLVLTVLFFILRCVATDYSRPGLATNSRYVEAVSSHSKLLEDRKERSLSLSTMMYEDKHWYSWILNFFCRLSNKDIEQRSGPDATLYLTLHVYIIILLCVLCVLSIGIILPINYLAGNLESGGGFSRTTISNLDPKSNVLWVHTLFSLLFLAITAVFMIVYSHQQLSKHQLDSSLHSTMVQWIPSVVHREDILQYLQEALPNSPIADVQMAYDVRHLANLNDKLLNAKDNLAEVESIKNELGTEETLRVGWTKLCCCDKSYDRDAKQYYDAQFEELSREIAREKEEVREKRLGIAFITFSMEGDAKKFVDYFRLGHTRPRSNVYSDVNAGWWWVANAPFPLDITWENLSVGYCMWWIRWILINALLLIFVFFFTTPAILLSSIDQLRVFVTNWTHIPDPTKGNSNSTLTDPLVKILIPNLLLLAFASLLPLLVSYSSYLEAHWTKSFREQTIMRKTYFFLLLMIVILPSVGLASLNALAVVTQKRQFQLQGLLGCIFLPNNGAFFIGYVITATFIKTGIKLLRVPELLLYMLRRCLAKTRLQKELALKKAADYIFKYGEEYAWNLVVFNMVISFSLTTPLIVPFGVVYFILNYFVDKYNIYYVYRHAPFNGRLFLHRSAVNFVVLGAAQLQLLFLFFSVIRLGNVNPRTIFMIVTFVLTCIICLGVMVFGWFKHLLPRSLLKFLGKEYTPLRSGKDSAEDKEEEEDEVVVKGAYIPPVLRDSPQTSTLRDHSSHSSFGYHSFGNTDNMGRKTSSLSPTLQQSGSTLERNASSKPHPLSTVGGVAGTGKKYETVGLKDPPQSKSFV